MEQQVSNKFNFRIATFASLGIMLVLMLWTSKDFGISGDELTQNTYGEKVFNYYATFGKDRSCFEPFGRITNAFYYGGFYDFLCVAVNKMLHLNTFNTRHFINAIFGFFIIVFVVRLAKLFKGWDAALLAAWFIFLSPRFFGESMNNPKDVPFALGMLMGVYYIFRVMQAFPKPAMKDMIGVTLSIALAINIRVGGIMLLPYLFAAMFVYYFFAWRKQHALSSPEMKRMVISAVVMCGAGYFLGLIFWPFGLEAPLSNPLKALGEMSQFSTSIGMLYEDKRIISDKVPWYYIPKWIFISSPLIVLLGFILSPWLIVNKDHTRPAILFLFFVTIFPVAYVIYKKSPLYDGWRHLFFVYPPLIVLSSLAFMSVLKRMKTQSMKYAVVGVVALGLALPAKYCIANHPNQIVYFNELVGGIDGAYGHYETDYYMNSLKQAAYKLAKDKGLFDTKDTIIIASNAIEPVIEYFKDINPRIVCLYVRYYQRYEKPWDYALLYTRFLDKDLLQNNYFPPQGTIDVIKADNTPLTAIVKADPERAAYKANQFMKENNFDSAIVYFEKHLKREPNDESSYDNYAIALANKGRVQEAAAAVNTKLKFTPSDVQSYELLIKIYKAIGDNAHANEAAMRAQAIIDEEQSE